MSADESAMEAARTRLGLVLRGKYRLDAVLGIGGMAVVYAATHRNQKRFAIKMLRADLSLRDDIRQRFLREGYVANSVDDPGAVTVLDDDIAEDGSAFLVMELLQGESVDLMLERNTLGVPAEPVVAMADALLGTLVAAHAKAIIHRDIKPGNLFVTRSGQLKVLDFGIARLRDVGSATATSTGVLLGTPAFMAPEQAGGNTTEVDARSDLFAVGATMFTLLTGRLVHDTGNATQMMVRAATATAPPVRSVRDVPEAVARVVDKALAFQAADRWADAKAMQGALREAALTAFGAAPGPESLVRVLVPRVHDSFAPDHTSAALMKTEAAPSTGGPGTRPPSTMSTGVAHTRYSAGPRAASRIRSAALVAGAVAIAAGTWLVAQSRARSRARDVAPPVTPVAPACTPSCAQAASPSVCRNGACVALASEDCTPLAEPEDVAADDTIWIGTMFPRKGQAGASFGEEHTNAANLARRDFSQVAHGIVTKTGAARHIAILACDDSVDPERAARHLVNDVHVPAVIGFYESQEAIDLARELFVPNGVVVVAANNHNPLVTAVPIPPGSPRLVWRTGASSAQLARPAAAFIESELTTQLRREHALGPDELPRVAVVRGSTATSLGFGDAIAVERSKVAGAAFQDTFRQFVLDDAKPDVQGALPDILAFRPHIVIDEFDTEGSVDVLESVETSWKHGTPPKYLLVDLLNEALVRFVSRAPERRRRVFGVDTLGNAANLKYALHYNEVYGAKGSSHETLSTSYDAFYLLAYAASAADDPGNGASIARAIPLLGGPGKPVEVGATGIFDGFNALHADEHANVVGTLGPLAFDAQTGNRKLDFAVICFRAGAGHPYYAESGMIFREAKGGLEGALQCP